MEKIKACYDNGGETFDRYTIVFNGKDKNGLYDCLGLSFNPDSPQGFSQWSQCQIGKHLGQKISVLSLPENIIEHIKNRLDTTVLFF